MVTTGTGSGGGRPPPEADPVELFDGWLADLGARLRGPSRARHAVLTELHDGLLEALDAHRAAGLAPPQAARAALCEFGEPAEVARAFAPELAGRQARRTALALIGTGPPVGLLWVSAAAASHLLGHSGHSGPPWLWPDLPVAVRVVVALLALVLLTGVPAGLLAVAATGRPGRWLPYQPRLAPTAATTLGLAALAVDLLLLATVGVAVLVTAGRLAWAPVTVAALASLIRLALNSRATRRLLATRAALG
jgi:hypothetical protein